MISAGDSVFVDTNVLVYTTVVQTKLHADVCKALRVLRQLRCELWISLQIMREYASVMSRPQVNFTPLSPKEISQDIRRLEDRFVVADEDADITAGLCDLLDNYAVGGKQIHDANIVATMRSMGVNTLLTENVNDFRRFEPLIQIAHITTIASLA